MRKYGTAESVMRVDKDDPQGLEMTAARREAETEDYDPAAVVEEGEDSTE